MISRTASCCDNGRPDLSPYMEKGRVWLPWPKDFRWNRGQGVSPGSLTEDFYSSFSQRETVNHSVLLPTFYSFPMRSTSQQVRFHMWDVNWTLKFSMALSSSQIHSVHNYISVGGLRQYLSHTVFGPSSHQRLPFTLFNCISIVRKPPSLYSTPNRRICVLIRLVDNFLMCCPDYHRMKLLLKAV